MKCAKCGNVNSSNSHFCSSCGNKLNELRCHECNNEITIHQKYCTKCGSNNDLFIEFKKPIVDTYQTTKKSKNKSVFIPITYLTTIFLALLALAATFGGILKVHVLDYDYYNNYELDELYPEQNSIQLYTAYFKAISVSNQREYSDLYSELERDFIQIYNQYETPTSALEFEEIYSKVNIYLYDMLEEMDLDNIFISLLKYLLPVVILGFIQLIPILILISSLVLISKLKYSPKIKNLFLLGGVLSLSLMFIFPDLSIMGNQSRSVSGNGLIIYCIIMFITFFGLKIYELKDSKVDSKAVFTSTVNIVLIVLLLFILFGPFIVIGNEFSSVRTFWSSFNIRDVNNLLDMVLGPQFLERNLMTFESYVFNLTRFSTNDIARFADINNYSYIFRYRFMDNWNTQFTIMIVSASLIYLLFIFSIFFVYGAIKNIGEELKKSTIFLKYLLSIFMAGLVVISFIIIEDLQSTSYYLNESFIFRAPLGLMVVTGIMFMSANIDFVLKVFSRGKSINTY